VRIRFIPEAEADLMDAYGWYNEQAQGLGHDRSTQASGASRPRWVEREGRGRT
jgi:hypothetical protein